MSYTRAELAGGLSDSQQLADAEERMQADLLAQEREQRWITMAEYLKQAYAIQVKYFPTLTPQQIWGAVTTQISSAMQWPAFDKGDTFTDEVRGFVADYDFAELLNCVARTMREMQAEVDNGKQS